MGAVPGVGDLLPPPVVVGDERPDASLRLRGTARPAGTDEHLGQGARRQQEAITRRPPLPHRRRRGAVLAVGRIESTEQDAGVQDYRSHSSRSGCRSSKASS